MALSEKEECMEILEYLGVFDCVSASAGKLNAEEFSFDKPNYGAFPAILRCLFKHLDEDECSRRFKDCWPLMSKADRAKFRQISLAWFQEIKKTEAPGTFPDLSSFLFENPFGDRYVKFLLGFSAFVLRNIYQRRLGKSFPNNKSNPMDPGSGHSSDALEGVPTEEDLENLASLLESETESTNKFLTETGNHIKSLERELLEQEDEEQKQARTLCECLKTLALRLKYTQDEIDSGSKDTNLLQFAEEVTGRAKFELQEYKMDFDHLKPLFEQCFQFNQTYKSIFEEKSAFQGVTAAEPAPSGQFKDVFLPDGRLDVAKLVEAVQSSVSILLEHARKASDEMELATISESSRRSSVVLALVLGQQKEMTESLNGLIAEIEQSEASLRQKIAKIHETRPPRPLPDWLRPAPTCNFKPKPTVDFQELLKLSKIDWNQVCASDGNITSDDATPSNNLNL